MSHLQPPQVNQQFKQQAIKKDLEKVGNTEKQENRVNTENPDYPKKRANKRREPHNALILYTSSAII